MKHSMILSILCMLSVSTNLQATDEWRVFGASQATIKSSADSAPFGKWHKSSISYSVDASAPSGFSALIDASFDTWEAVGALTFSSSGSDIVLRGTSGVSWFGLGPYTSNGSTGEILAADIYFNTGSAQGHALVWTNGTENVGGAGDWYLDVQNLVTHELGHVLGIAHHTTGNGEPTMATRAQVSDFNTTLKRRTLETDDVAAFNFLYDTVYLPAENSSLQDALNDSWSGLEIRIQSGTYTGGEVEVPYGRDLIVESGVTFKHPLRIKGYAYMDGATFEDASGDGIIVDDGGIVWILNSAIQDNSGYGVNIIDGDLFFLYTNIGNNSSIGMNIAQYGYASDGGTLTSGIYNNGSGQGDYQLDVNGGMYDAAYGEHIILRDIGGTIKTR